MGFAEAKKNVSGWRFCALMDSDKEVVKPQNGNNKTAAQNVKEMEQIIDSLPSGTYYLGVRNSPAAKWTYFPFEIGAEKTHPGINDGFDVNSYNSNLYAENVQLAVRNKELETLNKILEDKCSEYLQTIDDLEREIQDVEPEQLGAANPSLLETMLMSALPQILDKFTNANGSENTANEMPDDTPDAPDPGHPV